MKVPPRWLSILLSVILVSLLATCQQPTLSNEDTERLMFALLSEEDAASALTEIGVSGDIAFAAPLIDLLWISGNELAPLKEAEAIASALEKLTGQGFGKDWEAWANWYAASDIRAPDSIIEWKGAFFGRITPNFTPFFEGNVADGFRSEEIVWGGVNVDGIPSLDNLPQVPAAEAKGFTQYDAVFGLSINGDHRAYPLRIMDWHEMANDTVGGVPISIAYCTLCGAAIAYKSTASSGTTYEFGSSGLLYRSNKLMYDRQTRSLWNQLTGEPVIGEAVGKEAPLTVLPIVLTSWGDWREQHPDTTILPLDTGVFRDYSSGAAYGAYFVSDQTMFPAGLSDDRLEAKAQVFALRIDGQAKAYPLTAFAGNRVINDEIGDEGVVLVSAENPVNVHAYSYELEYISYSAGIQVQAYARGDNTFTTGATADTLIDQTGAVWTITDEALTSPDGEQLERLGGHLAFWFGWYAAYPDTLLFGDP